MTSRWFVYEWYCRLGLAHDVLVNLLDLQM
jgi:hypothetical protein